MNDYRRILFIIILIAIGNNITAETSKTRIKQDYIDKNQVIYINSIKNDLDNEQLSKIIDSIRNQGYFKLEIIEKVKIDSLNYKVTINLNQKFENIYIHDQGSVINFKDKQIKIIEDKKHYIIKIDELEDFLIKSSEDIANKGYSFNKIKLINIKQFDDFNLYASLNVELNKKRKTDKIIIKGYENFPKTFLKHYLKYSTKDDFNLELIKKRGKKYKNLGLFVKLRILKCYLKKTLQ